MRFPGELWETETDRQVVLQFIDAFAGHPIVLTDKLANTIFFNEGSEALFADRGEAIVNRLSFSLLGYGRKEKVPPGLTPALLGDGVPWRGVVNLAVGEEEPKLHFIEASAIRAPGKFLCGVIRFQSESGSPMTTVHDTEVEEPEPAPQPMRVAVLVSGRGSNLRAILQAKRAGKLPRAEIRVVICNEPKAGAIEVAKEFGIPTRVVDHREYKGDRASHDAVIARIMRAEQIELVVLAGYMRLLTPAFVDEFAARMINVHPSLLPSFPGINAQRQALIQRVRITGCTVHFVTSAMDGGPVILQRSVPVLLNDDEDSLSQRILTEEHRALPQAIDLFTRDRIHIIGGHVSISPGESSFPELENDAHAMTPMLLATGNMGKVQEICAILADIPLQFFTTACFPGYAEPKETGTTYLENARIKASYWARISGLWSLADDSGIEVEALGGRPGVFSARYAPTSRERINKLLAELRNIPMEKRQARFVATVVLRSPEGEEFSATGSCEGQIAFSRCGGNGFGYDPIFIPDGYGRKHLAELPDEVKNSISHRGRALQQLKSVLKNLR